MMMVLHYISLDVIVVSMVCLLTQKTVKLHLLADLVVEPTILHCISMALFGIFCCLAWPEML